MQYVKPKVHDETNYFNGVDLNDKEAVKKEFQKQRATHTFFTLIMIAIFLGLGVIAFDYFRVFKMEGRPLFATKKVVDGGVMYEGLGYQVLYCEGGDRRLGAVIYDGCTEKKEDDLKQVLYDSLVEYATSKKILDQGNLESLTLNEYSIDEKNDKEGTDYLLDLSVTCKNGNNCFNATKKLKDSNNFKLILRVDKYTHVYDIVYFKTSGAYYDSLVANYKDKVKQYMIDNTLISVDNLKSFNIRLTENRGKRQFKGTEYADSYLIGISYMCNDDKNACVTAFDKKDNEGDYSNMYFLASMFIDGEDNVALVGPREYLDL